MAYYSKYTGAELEEKLDKVEEIPQLIAQMITGKDFVTKEDLLCVLRDYAPATYATIPIDNNTIYWENGVLKAATSGGGQCQWELREHNGIQYLYSRLPVVTQYDVTMYADVNHLDLPSIYDGLPIDGDTIYWEETEDGKVLKAKSVGGSGENIDAGWVISVISNAGFATQNWINDQNFISSSLLYSELAKYVKIKDYQEIEGVKNFLNGLQIAGLPITKLNGYEDVIYIDANVVVRGGLTMYYEDGEIDLPSIKDEIGNAGYDGVAGLASFNSSQFSISPDGTVTIIEGSTGLNTAQLAEYLTTNKYATQGWITEQNYASASNLTALQSKVDNFLEGSDSDTIINKWLELEAFLSGLSESDNLATILSNKANKATTLAGYGITDAYTKTQLDNTFKLYIPIAGYTEITGEKNFTGGLRVNNSPVIYYDEVNKYWKLEGDLLVTGGVSMYSDDTDFIPSTIMDAVVVDGTSIRKNPTTGALEVIGGSGSTTKYPLSWSGFNQGSYDGSQAVSFYIPTKLSEFINDSSFATTGDLSNYQTKITSSNKLSYSLISGTPTSLKNPNSLKFGSKTYDGSSEQTILASDLGAITSHQTIYTLTFQSGTFSAGNFTANSAKQTINVPTTTSHISEGSNLYFTNTRAVSALKSTTDSLASDISTKWTQNDSKISNWDTAFGWGDHSKNDYTTNKYVNDTFVTLKTEQTITGKKNFTTGGLFVNGKQIHYDATNKYWKLEGDLLVTGGVTMYGDDGSDLPSIFDSLPIASTSALGIASFDSNYFSVDNNGKVTFIGQTGTSNVSILSDLMDVSPSVSGTATVDRVLFQQAGSATWVTKPLSEIGGGGGGGSVVGDYLPLSGGTLSNGTNTPLTIKGIADGSWISFINQNNTHKGSIGFQADNQPYAYHTDYGVCQILHSGNYSSYALPLSGGTLSGLLRIDFLNSIDNISSAVGLHVLRSAAQSDEWGAGVALTAYQGKGTVIMSGGYGGSITYYNGYSYLDRATLRWDNNGNLFVPNVMFEKGGSVAEQYKCGMYVWNNILQITKRQLDLTYIKELMSIDLSNEIIKCHVITEFTDYIQTDGRYAYIASASFNSVVASGGWAVGHILRKADKSFMGYSCGGFGTGDNLSYYFYGGEYDAHAMRLIGNNMLVTGGISMYSDQRKKTILNHVELSLKQIANAPLIQHYYNSDQDKTTHVGSIAQYWAGLNDWFCKLDAEGYYTMEIQNCALASAISIARHLEKYESKTDKKIRQLKKRISQLEDELELLKKGA